MKRLFIGCLLFVSSITAFAEGKIAVVNFEMAVFNTDVVKAKVQTLQADPAYKKNMEEIKRIQADAKKLVETVRKEGPTMSALQKEKAEADMKSMQSDMEFLAKKLKDAEAATLQPVMYQMQAQAMAATKEIVTAEGIGLLLSSSSQLQNVIYADTTFDISAKVTDKLNKLNKKP